MGDFDRSTVVGVFDNREQADCAMRDLREAGFTDDQLGLAMRNEEGTATAGSNAGKDAVGGAVTGGVLGGLLAAAASLLIPGIGPVIAGGVLAAALGGAAVGAAAGGLLGALVGMGVPEEDARYYDEQFKSGRVILTVKGDGNYDRAYDIIQQCGGYDAQHRDTQQRGFYGQTAPESGYQTQENVAARGTPPAAGEDQHIQLSEEELRARKERVQTGEVRVRKEVKTETKNIEVPVTREEVVIERRPVEGGQPSEGGIGQTEEIRVPVSEEQVRVEKRPVVREEIDIHKRPVQETEHVSEDVRREEARVERKGDPRVSGEDNPDDTTNSDV